MMPGLRPLRVAAAVVALALLAGCGGGASVPAPVQSIRVVELAEEPVVTRPDYHIVQPGETLIGIALGYGLDYKDLALWSAIADPDLIEVGQRIVLKEPEDAPVVQAVQSQKVEPVAAPGAAPASLVRNVEPERKVIGGAADDGQVVAQLPLGAPALVVKTGPKAMQHPYSEEKLAELRQLAADPARADPDELAFAPEEPAAPTAVPIQAAVPAPAAVREQFGNEWSWPVGGAPDVLEGFTDASRGMNIAGERGSPIFASADGEVLYAGSGMKGYGRLIVIRHGNDYVSAYGNNEELLVTAQDRVSRGQQIATMGDSGSQRVQLHFEIRKSGKPLDPLQFVPPAP